MVPVLRACRFLCKHWFCGRGRILHVGVFSRVFQIGQRSPFSITRRLQQRDCSNSVINKGRGPGGNGLRNEGTSHASLLWKEELLSVVKFRSRRFGVRKRGLKSSDSTWPDK